MISIDNPEQVECTAPQPPVIRLYPNYMPFSIKSEKGENDVVYTPA